MSSGSISSGGRDARSSGFGASFPNVGRNAIGRIDRDLSFPSPVPSLQLDQLPKFSSNSARFLDDIIGLAQGNAEEFLDRFISQARGSFADADYSSFQDFLGNTYGNIPIGNNLNDTATVARDSRFKSQVLAGQRRYLQNLLQFLTQNGVEGIASLLIQEARIPPDQARRLAFDLFNAISEKNQEIIDAASRADNILRQREEGLEDQARANEAQTQNYRQRLERIAQDPTGSSNSGSSSP